VDAEEYPLLEVVAGERLVKTQQAGKDLAGAMVICKAWRLAMTLQLLVVPNRFVKWLTNPISNPKRRRESLHTT
jgi:hypothetical protein